MPTIYQPDESLLIMENTKTAPVIPRVMDLEDYLGMQGVIFSASGYCLDKLRSNRQLRTERGKKRFEKECEEVELIYQEKRRAAIEEYNALVESGEVRPLTSVERAVRTANGHPDNPSVQAARRMCMKRGIDWKTGKKLEKENLKDEFI